MRAPAKRIFVLVNGVKYETEKAVLFHFEGKTVWVPKRVCGIQHSGDGAGVIFVLESFFKKNIEKFAGFDYEERANKLDYTYERTRKAIQKYKEDLHNLNWSLELIKNILGVCQYVEYQVGTKRGI